MITLDLAILANLTLLFAMLAHLARIDVKRFEIDIEVVLIAGMTALTLRYALGMNLIDGIVGALVLLAGQILVQRLSETSFGAGDTWLLGLMGLISGVQFMGVLGVSFVFGCLCIAACYSQARARPLLTSRIPMALPGAIATALTIGVMAVAPREMRSAAYSIEALIPHSTLARIATDAPLLPVVWGSFGLAVCALTALSYYRRTGAMS